MDYTLGLTFVSNQGITLNDLKTSVMVNSKDIILWLSCCWQWLVLPNVAEWCCKVYVLYLIMAITWNDLDITRILFLYSVTDCSLNTSFCMYAQWINQRESSLKYFEFLVPPYMSVWDNPCFINWFLRLGMSDLILSHFPVCIEFILFRKSKDMCDRKCTRLFHQKKVLSII